jgi:hypothetical protein
MLEAGTLSSLKSVAPALYASRLDAYSTSTPLIVRDAAGFVTNHELQVVSMRIAAVIELPPLYLGLY